MRRSDSRAFRLWGAVFSLPLAFGIIASGCGGDVPTNYLQNSQTSGGTGTNGGVASAGGAPDGMGGGDEATGGEGGGSVAAGASGGKGGSGASAGTSSSAGDDSSGAAGGGGGGAGMDAGCGDNEQQEGEECDDGNVLDGDGCSSLCTSQCETCESQHAWNDLDPTIDDGSFHEEAAPEDFSDFCYYPTYLQTPHDGIFDEDDIAVGGELAGQPRKKLWDALMACVRRTNCPLVAEAPNVVEPCYCGTSEDCTVPDGPCKAEFEHAAEAPPANAAATVSLRFYDPSYALGRATIILRYCDAQFCSDECF